MVAAFTTGFDQGRALSSNGHHRPPRTPLLLVLGRAAGRHAPSWRRAKSRLTATAAAGALTWAGWVTDGRLGAIVGALSLLALDWYMDADR